MSNRLKRLGLKDLVFLHCILLLYSLSSICSKLASAQPFFSLPFILLYGTTVGILLIYAVLWQQVLKRMPLTFAFANKAIVIVWGMISGALIFGEQITPLTVLGAVILVIGICLVVSDSE